MPMSEFGIPAHHTEPVEFDYDAMLKAYDTSAAHAIWHAHCAAELMRESLKWIGAAVAVGFCAVWLASGARADALDAPLPPPAKPVYAPSVEPPAGAPCLSPSLPYPATVRAMEKEPAFHRMGFRVLDSKTVLEMWSGEAQDGNARYTILRTELNPSGLKLTCSVRFGLGQLRPALALVDQPS